MSEKTNGQVWLSKLDLKNFYSQLKLRERKNKQCNFSIVGGDSTETYRLLTGFCGFGDMPNEFQRVVDSLLNGIPFTNCYIDDILVATKGTKGEQKAIVQRMLEI